MIVEFDTLAPDSKVWIFQSDRMLNSYEIEKISNFLHQFLISWASHGSELSVSFKIKRNAFIIIGVDIEYQNASGCSIDKLMTNILTIGKELSIDFFNRLNICVYNNESFKMYELSALKELLKKGKIDSESVIFNNSITTKSQLETEWKSKVHDTWLKKYIPAHV